MPAEDYYSDMEDSTKPIAPPEKEESEGEGYSATLPKSLFEDGVDVGERACFKVVRVLEDEVEVERADRGEDMPGRQPDANKEIDMMSEE